MYSEKKRSRYFKYPSKSYQKASQNKLNSTVKAGTTFQWKWGSQKDIELQSGSTHMHPFIWYQRWWKTRQDILPALWRLSSWVRPQGALSSGPKVPSAVVEAVSKLCANTKESITLTSISKGQRNQDEVRAQHANVHIFQGAWVPFIHSKGYTKNPEILCCRFSATQSYQDSAHPLHLDSSYFTLFWKQEREFSVRTNLLIWERSKEAHPYLFPITISYQTFYGNPWNTSISSRWMKGN